jgi:hypothetical protein
VGRGSEGKDYFIKNNMLEDDNVVSGEIKTLITLVINGVSEEDTMGGPGGQFVGSLCGEVGKVNTAENAQVLI